MKSLLQYINEKLIINKNTKMGYKYHPSTFDELRQLIEDRYKEFGPGTEQEPIDFNDIDVSGINTFYSDTLYIGVFYNINFEYIDISGWDVSNVENTGAMFSGCEKLKSVGDLSNWDVSNVESMYNMFYRCKNLVSVGDLSNWDVSNVENMISMFDGSGITNIPDWYKG